MSMIARAQPEPSLAGRQQSRDVRSEGRVGGVVLKRGIRRMGDAVTQSSPRDDWCDSVVGEIASEIRASASPSSRGELSTPFAASTSGRACAGRDARAYPGM